jgi:hypothetical protein
MLVVASASSETANHLRTMEMHIGIKPPRTIARIFEGYRANARTIAHNDVGGNGIESRAVLVINVGHCPFFPSVIGNSPHKPPRRAVYVAGP